MPPKKKKPPPKEANQDVMDIFGYIELIQSCVDQANENELVCLDGITKANIALRQTNEDPDIQCIVLIKRAELLYIAVKKDYDTEDLSETHGQPLDSCIDDCEQVLSKVSATGSGKSVREKATSLLSNARQLKKSLQREARAKKTQTQQKTNGDTKRVYSVFQRYDPTKALFKHITKINPYLLQDVVDCYKKARTICRTCYYKHSRVEQISEHNGCHCKQCRKSVYPLLLIPASKMCDNLAGSQSVSIPPPPKMLMAKINRNKPFQMCKNKDHTLCCDKSAVGDTWFAHSIEELVCWTIERYYGCKFSEYIRTHHRESETPNHKLFGQTPQGATSNGGRRNAYIDEYSSDDESGEYTGDEDEFEYYPEDCVFKNMATIPHNLLLDVIEMYHNVKEYCKWCFYKENKKSVVKFDISFNCTICSKCLKEWEPVLVIPASQLCWNFGRFEYLPLAPWPQGKPIKDSFEYCQKKDHFRCFRVYIENEFWYPHSVEEMIIWTVERERSCTFPTFIESLSRIPENLISTGSKMTTPHAMSANQSPVRKHVPLSAKPVQTALGPPSSSSAPNRMQSQTRGITKVNPSQSMVPTKPSTSQRAPTPVSAMTTVQSSKMNVNKTATATQIAGGVAKASLKQDFQYARLTKSTPVCSTQSQGGIVSQSAVKSQGAMTTNNNTFITSGSVSAYPYQQSSFTAGMMPISSLYKDLGCMSTLPDFQPSGLVQVTTVGIAITTSPEGVYRSAIVATSKISSGAIRSPGRKNYKVAPTQGSVMNIGGGSTTYEVQALSQTPLSAVISPSAGKFEQVFKFSEVNFKQISDIPSSLLKAISVCYEIKQEVCRLCFYEERVLSVCVQATNTCENGEHAWKKPLLVIPGCTMCDNEPCFERGDHVPIPPLPPVATIKKCQQKNHHKCYTKSLKSNEMFAHSIEALVVWIVESEKECSFEEYAAQKLHTQPIIKQAPPTNKVVRSPPPNLGVPLPINPGPIPTTPKITATNVMPQNKPTLAPPRNVPKPTNGEIIYHPKGLEFGTVSDIPPELLSGVAECFKTYTYVCRICFFESDCKSLVEKVELNREFICPHGHNPWREIKVIPRCRLCVSPSEWIPIPPLPKHMKTSKNPFVICKKEEHHTCYAMSKGTNPWFPHTVEEMVIWTVERETSKPYEEVFVEYLSVGHPPPQTFSSLSSYNREQKPPGFIKSLPVLAQNGHSFLPGVSLQSPTLRLDLEEAIKLANSSAIVSTQSRQLTPPPSFVPASYGNNFYGAFPNLVTNVVPENVEKSSSTANSGNSLGLTMFGPSQIGGSVADDAIGFFPALFGGADSFNLSSSDPFMNSGSFTGFGQHGQIGDKMGWDSQVPGQSWNSVPPSGPQQASHDQHQEMVPAPVGMNPDSIPLGDRNEPIPVKSAIRQSQLVENTSQNNSSLELPRMPNSKPLVLEKASEMDGFIKVKSKRQKRGPVKTSPPSSVPLKGVKSTISKPKFTDIDIDDDEDENSTNIANVNLDQAETSQEVLNIDTNGLDGHLSSENKSLESSKVTDVQMTNGDHIHTTVVSSQPNSKKKKQNSFNRGNKLSGSDSLSGSPPNQLSNGSITAQNGVPNIPSSVTKVTKADMPAMNGAVAHAQSETYTHVCLVCFQDFSNSDAFMSHCQSGSHCTAVSMTTGGDKLPKYPPPHLKENLMKLCKKRVGECLGAPHCKLAHSQEQLSSWKQEWAVIRSDAQTKDPAPVKLTQLTNGLRLSQTQMESEYPGLVVTVSRPCTVTATQQDGNVEWKITLQGQNWQTLLGVSCHAPFGSSPTPSLNAPIFNLTTISDYSRSVEMTGPIWEAEKISQGFLLGTVTVTVVGSVASLKRGRRESCDLRLNLGYKTFVYLPLTLKGEIVFEPVAEDVNTVIDKITNELVFNNAGSPPDESVQPFAGQWNLSHGSSSSDELGIPNIEGEDMTLHHVPIEDWGCSLTDDTAYLK